VQSVYNGQMETLEFGLISLILLSFCFSAIACVLVFAWRNTTPEIADLRRKFIAMSMAQTDIADKLNHWMQRDDARHARSGKKSKKHDDEDEYEEVIVAPVPQTIPEIKSELRARLARMKMA